MMCKKQLWIILALCFALSIWKMYISVSSVSKSLDEWLQQNSLMEEEMCYHNKCIGLSSWDWFCDHFDASVNCLLTLENSDIPPEVLQWWLKLQRSKDGSQIQKMVKYLFDLLQSPTAKTQDIVHCGTCAVVGNSGRLRGSKYGKKIDSHKFVMRMNTAQVTGFEEDVGTRTTHHFMYPESAMNLRPNVHLVLIPFKPLDLKWLASALSTGDIQQTYRKVRRFIKADKSKILIIHPGFLKYIHDKWTRHHGKYPSTGLIALMFAIHTCTRVSAFGFGADIHGNWHHYWEDNLYAGAFRKSGVHNGTVELQLIERLTIEGKLEFYK
ncbi:PREDICTED: CMP-N-acetylneuraminate-beta-galactosamide-alpha-2,3-sialyltransferase 2-like [Thamnophis sirtalis]|uniref:CMP-N-acetylneuraminate-beta-galactosamide-alpha-2,3-sialyltransferase 2 n=1 Tax=Thamnophis sirtalis TaxID=35019 RepID=A0A6I9Z100_9SAUR|nr:PREDICTED: CMP-N-acetylneuraminate-beta-galactosamide-alpha-2,3-sialyltransferase 2-like [Thamnophis sirtalis]XP_013929974.1 PREDICTED: CMP-N-acetylneuraminate-beta-galactosamide-alpha-2,3-sialyltransferase 2-like [Thamnophis sirtalis]XP_013929975.1 PREDICTED: CMP-N-acetylneuraminate-beta-galactosamide-alpha-2,3-sialyltransferase 2-like [Thamnophis sirtalis]XP_013929976.1 PREDICTED: CMP-N-acetylneuraminate-beta-galactosamide-alpha-2,3-sialyltransferase 2-like [Thamnophis sirtalis]